MRPASRSNPAPQRPAQCHTATSRDRCLARPVGEAAPLIYLSDRRTLFIGRQPATRHFAPAASRLLICLAGELHYQLHENGPRFACGSLLLPAGLRLAVDTRQALVADCYLDASGFDHAVLRQRARRRGALYYRLRDEAALRETLLRLHQQAPPPNALWACLEPLLNPADLVVEARFAADPRIARTIERIKDSTGENLSLEHLAQEVGLSASRLLSLFKQEVGIPIRRYRLWRRLHQSTHRLSQGWSLTDAAMAAGFADSSHFSRTCMAMLGIQPSVLVHKECGVRILPGPDRLDPVGGVPDQAPRH